ncbi:phosphatase PAP2 family protein [Haloimpatiens sp. FM7330]|uniref:phosphatase PAP2 family protein n=1 Tax=Haloimpatiens sp. FM7330 TaxID=3298610 RepID=UPI00362B7ED9
MRRLKRNVIALLMILLIPIVNIVYPILNNAQRGVSYIVTDIDRAIPLVKIFVIPYLAWYPFIVGTLIYLCFKDKKTYYNVLISLIMGLISCYIIYFFFQTGIPRPNVSGDDVLTKILRFVYNTDNPYNCFPSIHVLTSYLMIKGILDCKCRNAKNMSIVITSAILIIISTELIKQHVILDIISAIILSEVLYKIAMPYKEKVVLLERKLYLLIIKKCRKL